MADIKYQLIRGHHYVGNKRYSKGDVITISPEVIKPFKHKFVALEPIIPEPEFDPNASILVAIKDGDFYHIKNINTNTILTDKPVTAEEAIMLVGKLPESEDTDEHEAEDTDEQTDEPIQRYQIVNRGSNWFDVVDTAKGTPANDKALRQEMATQLADNLNTNPVELAVEDEDEDVIAKQIANEVALAETFAKEKSGED